MATNFEQNWQNDPTRRTAAVGLCPTRAFPREDVRWGCARIHVYVYCT